MIAVVLYNIWEYLAKQKFAFLKCLDWNGIVSRMSVWSIDHAHSENTFINTNFYVHCFEWYHVILAYDN